MRQNKISDGEIFKGIQSGEAKKINLCLEYLYKSNYPIISRFILGNNGNESEAQDIFQDAIIVFYEKVQKGNLELSCNITTYLYSVSRNLWLKRLKSKMRSSLRIEDIQEFISVDDEASEIDNEKVLQTLNNLINKLSKKCKEILIAFYYDNMSMRKIMNLEGYKSEQAMKNKKYKCMKELMSIMDSSMQKRNILKEFLSL